VSEPSFAQPAAQAAAAGVPRLVDLGPGKCIPCKAMAPILEELRAEFAGRMRVQFIDVWKDPEAAKPCGIHIIPTQIFYGASTVSTFSPRYFSASSSTARAMSSLETPSFRALS